MWTGSQSYSSGFLSTRHPAVPQQGTSLDTDKLKQSLNTICDNIQSAGARDGPKLLQDLCTFLDNASEQSCTSVQDLFGQHVANNVIFIVMGNVLQPALRLYNETIAKRRQVPASFRSTPAEEDGELGSLISNKAKKLRNDIARPWRALIEIVHHNLPVSVLQQQVSAPPSTATSMIFSACGSGACESRTMSALSSFDKKRCQNMDGRGSGTFTQQQNLFEYAAVGISEMEGHTIKHLWAVPPNHTSLPLLWKNAALLNCVTQRTLEVLCSDILSSACGQEFAHVLLDLFLFDGYLSNLKSSFIVDLTVCLLALIERTVYEPNSVDLGSGGNGLGGRGDGDTPVGEVRHSDAPPPSVEEGTTYASLLVQLFRAPHILSAFTPSEDTVIPIVRVEVFHGRKVTLPSVMQQLLYVTMQRHQRPTCALRLEEHLLVAVNHLITIARDDYPLTSSAPMELLKPLCHAFYATTRRDGWRLEALTLLTTQISASFSSVLAQSAHADIERHRPSAVRYFTGIAESWNAHTKGKVAMRTTKDDKTGTHTQPRSAEQAPQSSSHVTAESGSGAASSVRVAPRHLAMLHETVVPFMQQLFTVARSEFNFVSRRELSHFPCMPLAPLFEFGAVVLYLACSTHETYMALPSNASNNQCEEDDGRKNAACGDDGDENSDDNADNGRNIDVSNSGCRKRTREGTERSVGGVTENKGSLHPSPDARIHPSNLMLNSFRSLFFLNDKNSAAVSVTRANGARQGGDVRHVSICDGSHDGPASSGCRQGTRTSAAPAGCSEQVGVTAVQNILKDGSLFMLHLFAQPCATLGFTESQCTSLVRQGILPIFPYHSGQLESLLLAALYAVGPRTSVECQQEVFRWLVRRYLPAEATQREEESHPKEQVYALLSLLIERGVIGQWPLFVGPEERVRLQSAVHFGTFVTRIHAVIGATPSQMQAAVTGGGAVVAEPGRQRDASHDDPSSQEASSRGRLSAPVLHAAAPSLASASNSSALSVVNSSAKTGLSLPLFKAMMHFLSSYHQYGATGSQISALCRASNKRRARDGSFQLPTEEQLMDLPAAASRLSTGLAFVIAGLTHAVCFFSHDDGTIWKQETDSLAATIRSTELFEEVLRFADDYALALCLIITESTMRCQHSLLSASVPGGGDTDTSKMAKDNVFSVYGGGRSAASLCRIREKLSRSRRAILSFLTAPDRQLPASVCSAVQGHWLLLYQFLSTSREELQLDISELATREACNNFDSLEEDQIGVSDGGIRDHSGIRLRRGDVPAVVVEVLATEVSRAVKLLASCAAAATASAGFVDTELPAHNNQQGMTEESVTLIHRKLCIHAMQLLHFVLRLYRLGIWHLPDKRSKCPYNHTKGSVVGKGDEKDAEELRDRSGELQEGVEKDEHLGDLYVLLSFPPQELFDQPTRVLDRLPTDSGKMYYAIMWICRYLTTRFLRDSLIHNRAVLRALLVLLHDVGGVFLSQSMALWEPRQTILTFVGAVCRRTLNNGIKQLASWRPADISSMNTAAAVHATMRLCCRLLGTITALVRRTRVVSASQDPLVNPEEITSSVVNILVENELITPGRTTGDSSTCNEGGFQAVLKPRPFVPFVLASVDSLTYLLQVMRGVCGDARARSALHALLETLFKCYSHALYETVFVTFSYYAFKAKENKALTNSGAEARAVDFGEHQGRIGKEARESHAIDADNLANSSKDWLHEEGRLLEFFVDRVSDNARGDFPPLTPQRQCAIISAIYALLFLCEGRTAEKLSRYIFSFFSPGTAYIVRQHTALKVRLLFSRFSGRVGSVMRELLASAREGMVSASCMSCLTSLRAVGEAARAVPSMEARIVCTLLECWATLGFVHKNLLLECLELIGDYAHSHGEGGGFIWEPHTTTFTSKEDGPELLVSEGRGMSAQQLCHYHREKLLFDWLWRLGHPLDALPVECFGYSCVQQLWKSLMPLLIPLAMLCSTRHSTNVNEAYVNVENDVVANVFLQPNNLLWRLAACHHHHEQKQGCLDDSAKADEEGGIDSVNDEQQQQQKLVRTPELLVSCITAHFADVVARLLLYASLSKRGDTAKWITKFNGEPSNQCQTATLEQRGGSFSEEEEEHIKLEDAGYAGHVALEWLRCTLSDRYVALVRRNADAILCRFVELVSALSPYVGLEQLRAAVTLLCEAMGETHSTNIGLGPLGMQDAGNQLLPHGPLFHGRVVDSFFASDGGDHAYVLLQRVYVCITHNANRGTRRVLLARIFRDIVKEWWSADLLRRVPHISHTVLRMCGNVLMSCLDLRHLVCDVLKHTWSVISTSPVTNSSVGYYGVSAADKAFISTIMLALVDESGVVSSTWETMKRLDRSLTQGRIEGSAESIHNSQGAEEEVKSGSRQGEEEQRIPEVSRGPTIGVKEAASCIKHMLTKLENVIFVSGAPASAFYDEVASAVDHHRSAFVVLIRLYRLAKHQSTVNLLSAPPDSNSDGILNAAYHTYKMCCQSVHHLLSIVCADSSGHSPQSSIASATTYMAAAATGLQTTTRDAQLSAFRLLRALCWCFIESGCESYVGSLFSPTADIHGLLQEYSLDQVLHRVYRQQLEQLYRLSFDADACNAHIASTTLRGWLCAGIKDTAEEGSFRDDPDSNVNMEERGVEEDKSVPKPRRPLGGSGTLIQQTLKLVEEEEKLQQQNREVREENQLYSSTCSFVRFADLVVFSRRLTNIPLHINAVRVDPVAERVTSLRSSVVWDALRVHDDEPRFLRLFLVALIRQYKLQERLDTIATVLNCVLLRTQVKPKGEDGDSNLSWFVEGFLPTTLLHVMLLKETQTQREERMYWSKCLEQYLFKHARRYPHTARLFLRAINVCRSAVMSSVRSRGVRVDVLDGGGRRNRSPSVGLDSYTSVAGITFPPFARSEYGDPPDVSDMKDSYWLSDIDPLALAAAAAACHEPHLAVLFAELSGESLLGCQRGIPSVVGEASATFVSGTGAGAQSQKQSSVLFPSVNVEECHRSAVATRPRHLRSDAAQHELARRLFDFRSAVHAILVDVKEALRLQEDSYEEAPAGVYSGSGGFAVTSADVAITSTGAKLTVPFQSSEQMEEHTTPWEEAFLLRHPMRRIEQEKSRGNWKVVLSLLDSLVTHNGKHVDNRGSSRNGISEARIVIEKANALMHLGDPGTALHILASALERKLHTSLFEVSDDSRDVIYQPLQGRAEEEELKEGDCMQLRGALAGVMWRSGKWDLSCLHDSSYQQQRKLHNLLPPNIVTLDEGIYHALKCMRHGEQHDAQRWCAQAQQHLLRQLDASNWRSIMLKAEALQQIEDCSKTAMGAWLSEPPRWVNDSFPHVRVPYDELQLLDSVQQQLCVACKQPKWWLDHLGMCSERALRSNKPLLVQQWVSLYEELSGIISEDTVGAESGSDTRPGGVKKAMPALQELTSPYGLPATVFISLVQARVEFACGYPHRAIAILQNIEADYNLSTESPSAPGDRHQPPSPSFALGGHSLPLPRNAPLMPPVVQQLVAWAMEARLVPLSQLVRDPFFHRSSVEDQSGCCSLQLARLCHVLTRDIAERLRGHNYRVPQEDLESLQQARAALQQRQEQIAASAVSREEKNLLRRRISGLIAERENDEREFVEELEAYALYRRSALNSYSRFMQMSGRDGNDNDILAVFGFVSLWLHQDEQYVRRDTSPATGNIITKAIQNTPLHKFLPLYSQLVAQLGTSLDDKNLEDLVIRIAAVQPLRAVWPLLALANGHVFGPTAGGGRKGTSSTGAVHVVDEKKVAMARRILDSLKGPYAVTSTNNKNLGSLGSIKEEQSDKEALAFENGKKLIKDAEKLSAAYIQLAFHHAEGSENRCISIPKDFLLIKDELSNLSIPPPTLSTTGCNYLHLSSSPSASLAHQQLHIAHMSRVVRYERAFSTPGGINLPKLIRCLLSDGRTVQQLLKSQDDLRQDSMIQQVFTLSNALFEKHPLTRQLRIYTYNVIPLAPTVGLIEWVDGTISLDRYLNSSDGKCRSGAHERYFPNETTSQRCRIMLSNAPKSQKHATLLSLYEGFSPALHYFFLEHFFTPQEWLQRREAYTRSVAASSMLGYVVGLGDRHANNLLLHVGRAELVHIDLGFAFDQGKLLPIPELVPFRLTRNIVDGFGVQGTEGPFRYHCEGALHLLRGQKELLTIILAACAHDPLTRWAVKIDPTQKQKSSGNGLQNFMNCDSMRQQGVDVSRKRPTFTDAERVLTRVAEKIQGYESGELLSVRTHVQKLLQTAQNAELLAQMYHGWSPWL